MLLHLCVPSAVGISLRGMGRRVGREGRGAQWGYLRSEPKSLVHRLATRAVIRAAAVT